MQPDNLTMPRAHKKLGGALTSQQRELAQSRFLDEYRQCGNVKYSCLIAGISRETFYQWKKNSKTFQKALEDAEPDVNDTVEYAAYEEGVLGVEEPVVSMGKVVYLDGQPLMVRRRNPTVLITLLKARMPDKYRERHQVNTTLTMETDIDQELLQRFAAIRAAKAVRIDEEPT